MFRLLKQITQLVTLVTALILAFRELKHAYETMRKKDHKRSDSYAEGY